MKKLIIYIGVSLIIYIVISALNTNYQKGIEECSKEHDLEYCKMVMAR